LEIPKPVERLSQGAFPPHNIFKAKSPKKCPKMGINVRFTTKTSESGITMQDTQK
jgi:hypothetical protein